MEFDFRRSSAHRMLWQLGDFDGLFGLVRQIHDAGVIFAEELHVFPIRPPSAIRRDAVDLTSAFFLPELSARWCSLGVIKFSPNALQVVFETLDPSGSCRFLARLHVREDTFHIVLECLPSAANGLSV